MKETFKAFKLEDGTYFKRYTSFGMLATDKISSAYWFGFEGNTRSTNDMKNFKGKFVTVTISDEETPTSTTRKEPSTSNRDTSIETHEGDFGSTGDGNHSEVVQKLLKAHKEGQKVRLHGVLSQEDIRDLEGLGYLVSHDYDLDKDTYNVFWLVKSDTSSTNYRVNVVRLLNAYALGEGCADYELTGTSSVLHHLPAADVQQLHELGYKVIYQDVISYTMIYLARVYNNRR